MEAPKQETRICWLYSHVDGEDRSVKVPMSVRSMAVRNRYFTAATDFQKQAAKMDTDHVVRYNAATAEEKPVIQMEYNAAIAMALATARRELFLAIIDTKQIPTADKELLAGGIDTEFWQNVNFEAVEREVEFFRTAISIGS